MSSITLRFILANSKIGVKKLEYFDHHLSHAHAAYYFSGLSHSQKTLVLSIDGSGDGLWLSAYIVQNKKFNLIGSGTSEKIWDRGLFDYASIGELYGNFTQVLGFKRNSDEGKVVALAAFGKYDEKLVSLLWECFQLNGLDIRIIKQKVSKIYNLSLLERYMQRIGRENFAASIQKFLEDFVLSYVKKIKKTNLFDNICLSGGVVANIILNLKLYESLDLKNFYVFPAMGDDGSSAGAAILSALNNGENLDWLATKGMPYYGQEFARDSIIVILEKYKRFLKWEEVADWESEVAKSINNNQVVALFQGRMEFGPRALGNRSILANPKNKNARKILNLKIKNRPEFQPFCPSILSEERRRLFKKSFEHKFMATAFRLKRKYHSVLPSIIHVDGTSRPQFVKKTDNPCFWKILSELKKLNGFGAVINTSFNLHGRAMVRSPEDAILDFLACKLDMLFFGKIKVQRVQKIGNL